MTEKPFEKQSLMLNVPLKDGEHILHIERSALIPYMPLLLVGVVLTVIPFFFFFPFLVFGIVGLIPPLLVAGLGLFLVLRTATRWRGSVCVLTNKRIIAVRQVGFVDRRVNGASLSKVNDVAYRRQGLMGSLLRIGSVRVLFKGVLPTMHFERIRRPEVLHDIISELRSLSAAGRSRRASSFERVHLNTPTS